MTKHRVVASILALAVGSLALGKAWALWQQASAVAQVQQAAVELIGLTSDDQREALLLPLDSAQRVDWHFIPKDQRKGVKLGDMREDQREAVHELLRGLLSQMGYRKATGIMQLESVLHAFEQGRGPIRDPLRYYVTFFGDPRSDARWGVSVEGHHLSLNYVLDGGRIVASTPQFFGSNPAIVPRNSTDVAEGTRVLELEETLAFELVNSLNDQQREVAVIAQEAPRDIRAGGEPQPPQDPPVGLAASELSDHQKDLLWRLIDEYIQAMPEEVAQQREADLEAGGRENIHFAWAGALQPGVGHYYRIQGPTFLIELDNTQPDPLGNPANHVHSVWRDMRGDFGIPLRQ